MAVQEQKQAAKVITLPEGRVINHSLFKLDQFDPKSKPAYRVELAFPKDNTLEDFMAELLAYADGVWGAPKDDKDPRGILNIDGGDLISGILDGDVLAERRAEKGKTGDAYKGMYVIRAKTSFNKHGVEGEGGAVVYGPDVELIEPVQANLVYPGCYGVAAVTLKDYLSEDKRAGKNYPAITIYLTAFQKTRDGEKLVSQSDHSKLFKPVGRQAAAANSNAEEGGGRRRRAG